MLQSLGQKFFVRISNEVLDVDKNNAAPSGYYSVELSAADLGATELLTTDNLEEIPQIRVGSALLSIPETRSQDVQRCCNIVRFKVETRDRLTNMEAFAAILRRIQSFCAERHVEHLAMAHVRPCWFSDLLKLAGFKDCECELPSKRLGTIGAGLQLCMVLPSQPTESPTVIGAERSHVGNASILLDQEDRAHLAVPSAVTALKDLIADFPRRPPTDHTRRKMPAEIAADRNHFGNASMSLDQEDHAYLAVPPAVTAPESLTADFPRLPSPDHTQRKMPAFIGSDRSQFGNAYMLLDREDYAHSVAPPEVTAPKGLRADFPRRPSPDQTEKKGYCMFWLRRGECDYMQKGCRYLHEMPVDKETREKIGLRKIPEWFKESPEYDRFLRQVDQSARGPPTRPHSDKTNPSTALLSGQGSNQKGNRASLHRSEKAAMTRRRPVQDNPYLVQSPRDDQHQRTVASKRDAKTPRAVAVSGTRRQVDIQTYKPPGSRLSSSSSDLRAGSKESSNIKDEEQSEGWARSDAELRILGNGTKR